MDADESFASSAELPDAPLIWTQSVCVEYPDGTRAVDGLDLEVASGMVFGLLGANGAGKSTTIRLLLGLVSPTAGRAEIAGIDVARSPIAARRACAYVPELVALYESFSGVENLQYFASLGGRDLGTDEATELLRDIGLGPDVARQWSRRYSKGMRQKVGLAIALAKRARVLLLDEPLSGLDPKAAHEFCATLESTVARGNLAVLMATHDLFRARRSCTRLGIMRSGRIISEMPTSDLVAEELEAQYLKLMGDPGGEEA
ncbi:MAG: ABC transporter ATP-binding protein [Deltaproteobacteria bacterium]|nr:ABC transporter ATP-binding protein [Nannocystaceae bacterium]